MGTIKRYPDAGVSGSGGSGGSGGGAQGTDTTYVANCDPSLQVGQVVWLVAADDNNSFTATPVDVTQLDVQPASGVVDRKYSDVLCSVARFGIVTVFSGLSVGKRYWVGTAGTPAPLPINNMPVGGCYQGVGVAVGSNALLVNMDDQVLKTVAT